MQYLFASFWLHCRKVAELAKYSEWALQRYAERRDRAQACMEKASEAFGNIQPARMANSDAKALTRYLGALGLEVGPDRVNNLLVLLAVILIEVGGGLSLAIGMALSGPLGSATAAPAPVNTPDAPANALSVRAE